MAKKKKAKKKSMLVPHPKGKPRTNKKKVVGNTLKAVGAALMLGPSLPVAGAGMAVAGTGSTLSGHPKKKTKAKRSAARKSRVSKATSIGPAKKKKAKKK
jgi:hypothetical protein